MGIWILYLIVTFSFPIFEIAYGSIYRDKVPKNINGGNGYKTAMSRLNRDTWEFANRYYNKLIRLFGWVLLALSFVAAILIHGRDDNTLNLFMGILIALHIAALLGCMVPTENALRKTFDKNGHRR